MDSEDEFDFESIVEETRKEANVEPETKGKKSSKKQKEERIPEKELKRIAAKPSQEEIKKREDLLLLICRYGNSARFGDYLRNLEFEFDIKKLRQMDCEQLEDMLTRIEAANAHKNQTSVISTGVKAVTGFIEQVTARHSALKDKYNCTGLTMALEQNPDYLDALEELDIKYGTRFKMNPEYRIMLAIGGSMTTVIAANRNLASMVQAAGAENKQQAPTPPPTPAPAPAAEEGLGLGGEPPQEKAQVDPLQQELNKLGFAR